ncbi:aldo/keto reductase [Actinoplanes sp. CA-030573]|uniref:aldo/keto reductase n=1 Tax=Actinoplanes sp. CA-030573 TaxID=3239898 RepID=UPI003D8B6252
MEYTRLGNSGLKVSRITLGGMSIGEPGTMWGWSLGEDAAQPLLRRAVELGITFWDTANAYAYGSSEQILGRAVKKYTTREKIVLATKLYWPMHDGPGGSGLSRKAIFEQTDASLAQLGTDYIDLLQIHRFDPEVPVEETMQALHDVVTSGRVRYIGASSMYAWQFAKLQTAAQLNGWTRFISMQDQYNLAQREEEREMFGLLADQGVASMPWSPLAAGLLARPWGQAGTTRSQENFTVDQHGRPIFLDSDKAIVDAVEQIAKQRGVAMASVALAWVLRNPVVSTVIAGATKDTHLTDAVAALDITLTDDEVNALESPYTPREPTYF